MKKANSKRIRLTKRRKIMVITITKLMVYGTLVVISYDVFLPLGSEKNERNSVQGLRQEEVHKQNPQYNSNSEIVAEISGSQYTNEYEEATSEVRILYNSSNGNDGKASWEFDMKTHDLSKIVRNQRPVSIIYN
jgi:hypothetical protein